MSRTRKDHRIILVYVNQAGRLAEQEGKPTTLKKAQREARRLNQSGNKARVERVARQGLL
jgi:hypothetical protein